MEVFWRWGLIILAAALRLGIAIHDPLWLDERHTLWTVQSPWSEVAARAAAGNQFPVYFWLNWFCCGGNLASVPLALRGLSLISGVALVWSAGWIAFRATGNRFSQLAAIALLAIDSSLLFLSSEARPYSLLQLVALWQVFLLIETVAVQTESNYVNRRAVYCWLLAVIGLCIHPIMMILVCAECCLLLIVSVGQFIWRHRSHDGGDRHTILANVYRQSSLFIALGLGVALSWFWLNSHSAAWRQRELWQSVTSSKLVLGTFTNEMLIGVTILGIACWKLTLRQSGGQNATNLIGWRAKDLSLVIWVSLFLICLLTIVAAEELNWLSLALPRYLSMVQIFPILAAAMLLAPASQSQSKRPRRFAVGLSLLVLWCISDAMFYGSVWLKFSLASTPRYSWFWQSISQATWLPQRFENWHQVQQAWLREIPRRPLFIVGNILEDEQLADGKPDWTRATSGIALIDYLKFPLAAGLDPTDYNLLQPLSTFATPRLRPEHWALIKQSMSFVCVVRGDRKLATEVIDEFARFAEKYDHRLVWELRDADNWDSDLYWLVMTAAPDNANAVD